MADENWSWSRCGLTLAGYTAAAALFGASVVANLRYGLSLAHNPLDKAAYGAVGCAIDVFKASLLIFGTMLWHRRHRIIASASVVLWLGCVAWSLSSAIGFAVTTRAEANAARAQERADSSGWSTTVIRAESQLSTLSKARPAAVVQADLAAVTVPGLMWRRTRECTEVTTSEKQRACGQVVSLRRELIAAQVAERLEGTLNEARNASSDLSSVDPQAAALSRMTGFSQRDVRTGLALLLAGLIEVASAMGFAIVGLAIAPKPRSSHQHPSLKEAAAEDTRHEPAPLIDAPPNLQAVQNVIPERSGPIGRATILNVRRTAKTSGLSEDVEAFLQARMLPAEEGRVGSTILHAAFNDYCRSHGLPERSQQALGKELTRLCMPKVRCTRSGRFEYTGLVLKHQQRPSGGSSHPNLPNRSKPKVQATAAGHIRVKGAAQNAIEGRPAPRAEPTIMLQPA